MESRLSGLLNIVALFVGALLGGTSQAAALGGVVGLVVATAAARPLGGDDSALSRGLYGFNGLLVGVAIPTFLGGHTNAITLWSLVAFASATSTLLTIALGRLLSNWSLPGLTFPFVLTTWIALLAVEPSGLFVAAPASQAATVTHFGAAEWMRATLNNISQIYLVEHPISGLIFLVAIAVHSRAAAVLALAASLLSVGLTLALAFDPTAIAQGLWGYSAILTAVALGAVFNTPSRRASQLAMLGAVVTLFLHAMTATLAAQLGLPALTFPFVLATWLFMLLPSGDKSA